MSRVVVALGVAGVAVSCGGKGTPCTGTQCFDLSGGYQAVYNPRVNCPTYTARVVAAPSLMQVSSVGSQVTITLNLSAEDTTVHTFTGTQDVSGTGASAVGGVVSVQEAPTDPRLGVPYGQINGTFTPQSGKGNQPPFIFTGQLILINQTPPTGGTGTGTGASIDAGAGACSGPYNITAQQQTDASGAPFTGAPVPTDGGSGTTDGG